MASCGSQIRTFELRPKEVDRFLLDADPELGNAQAMQATVAGEASCPHCKVECSGIGVLT